MGQVLVPLTFTIVGTFPAFIALCCNTERNKENRIIKIGSVYVKAAERLREKVKKNVPFCRVSLRQRSILSNTVRYTLHLEDMKKTVGTVELTATQGLNNMTSNRKRKNKTMDNISIPHTSSSEAVDVLSSEPES
jgi:hypothetical protein